MVLISFLLVLPRQVKESEIEFTNNVVSKARLQWFWTAISLLGLIILILAGILGSQVVSENILPTLFWLIVWIAVPLSCGIIGDWTQNLNAFSWIAKLTDSSKLRQRILGKSEALSWPDKLGWWPAVALLFILDCGELIFNQTATKPVVIASCLLIYFGLSGFMGLLFGNQWLNKGEVFSVLFSTWGKLGFWRFGKSGKRGFCSGLLTSFEPDVSRTAFVLLLLVGVAFDGLLATPLWANLQHNLPSVLQAGTLPYQLFAALFFLALAIILWLVFAAFGFLVSRFGGNNSKPVASLAGLLPSLMPISFGYLLAHNLQYLMVNSQLLFPLIGNPVGKESWPIHLPYPFNDSFEPNIHIFSSAVYWYIAVAVIIAVHVIAVVLAHRHLAALNTDDVKARNSEFPWIIAMIGYTMLSLWLLAQPLVKEKTAGSDSYTPTRVMQMVIKNGAEI